MIGDTFKNLKNKYTEITVSKTDIDKQWELLVGNLPEQDLLVGFYNRKSYGIAFASAFLILLLVTIGLAQGAKPGSLLYPVHIVTEELTKEISNVFQFENHVISPKIHISTPKMLPTATIRSTVKPTVQSLMQEKVKNNESHTKVLGSHTANANSYLPNSNANNNSIDNSSHEKYTANKNRKTTSKNNNNNSTNSQNNHFDKNEKNN